LTQLSTPDRASLALLLLNWNLYKGRTTCRVWYLNFRHKGGIYRGEWDLHQLGEVSLAPGGGRLAGWSGHYRLSPLTRASPPRVDAWQPRLGLNRLKPWPAGHGVGPADWPLCPLGLGSGPLAPCVKYTPVVMMILRFGPLKCSNLVPELLKSNKH
jgi:hypothetical protein